MTTGPRILKDYLLLSESHLKARGVDSPRLDAELLLCDVLGLDRVSLYTNFDRPLSSEEVDRYREFLRRRAAREPVAYILGRKEFRSLEFAVDRRVLVPRPETELLVELALEALEAVDGPVRAADVGTGSGAIAVSLAHALPELRVAASDCSGAALEVAPGNARRHGVEDRVEFHTGDLLEPLAGAGRFHVICSNPPYISMPSYRGLEQEIRHWEPRTALVSGDDGMAVTRRLIETAPEHLEPGGWIFIEVGEQAGETLAALKEGGWIDASLVRDLAGIDRVARARRPEAG